METSGLKLTATILRLLLTLFLLPKTPAKLTDQELDAAVIALRSHGYTLFPNAMATTDLRLHLLTSNSTFTLFAPPDPYVFSLDLSSSAIHYARSLFLHVSPSFLSTSDLRGGVPYIDTLLPNHRHLIASSFVFLNGTVRESVLVDNVRVSVPDLFLGSSIAVHGLEGILPAGFESGFDDDTEEYQSGYAPANSPSSTIVSRAPMYPPSTSPISPANIPSMSEMRTNWRGFHDGRGGGIGPFKFAKIDHHLGL
ncbi:hypothetical protein K2173_014639 [Erythroxylum novogranatense]|uniref:FAS1 domain-containing protein n=1 Tax=Erythroxylum novogranatense TaxID=1862640 RepID=A0AAV8TF53_9ROSI|nr:hypothetical protein K2173_014639 [Erythroxylum novogranatense]